MPGYVLVFGDYRGFCFEEPHPENTYGAWTIVSYWGFWGFISTTGKFFKLNVYTNRYQSGSPAKKFSTTEKNHKNPKNPLFAFRPGLVIDTDYSMKVLYGSDMDSGNKTGLLLDALDVLDAFQQPQGLVIYGWRRVRQVRRVDLQFVTALLCPRLAMPGMALLRKVASGRSKRGRPYKKCLRNLCLFFQDSWRSWRCT